MFCPHCKNHTTGSGRFCPRCGTEITRAAPEVAESKGSSEGSATVKASERPSPAGSDKADLIGRVFEGKYRIEAKLGDGGMGAVYLARRLHIGDSVAIKVLHPELAADGQSVE